MKSPLGAPHTSWWKSPPRARWSRWQVTAEDWPGNQFTDPPFTAIGVHQLLPSRSDGSDVGLAVLGGRTVQDVGGRTDSLVDQRTDELPCVVVRQCLIDLLRQLVVLCVELLGECFRDWQHNLRNRWDDTNIILK